MRCRPTVKKAVLILLPASLLGAMTIGALSCGFAPTPFIVQGPGGVGNEAPTLTITEPIANLTVGQGDPFLIRWTDTDRDSNALISFSLLSTTSNAIVPLVSGIDENDSIGPDVFGVSTTLIPPGTYFIRGIIDDGENPPVERFALLAGQTGQQRVVVTLVGPGQGPQTVPPRVTVVGPVINLSVAQDDLLNIEIRPTALPPAQNLPYDPDSLIVLYVLLDTDLDPNNDDPANPGEGIIVLATQTVAAGSFNAITVSEIIDLSTIPPRDAGEPYFIRATVADGTNPPVHSYAVGTISVVQLVSGTVDLFDVGRTKSGALFKGFSPEALLGSSISTVSDFDADGTADFVMVAQFGNPQNVGPVGEGYLVYGQGTPTETGLVEPGNRFGGTISVNTIADTLSGVIFQAPPIRTNQIPDADARTDGITDVSFVPDLTGDGRPDLLFGLAHVHGAWDSMDWDPEDATLTEQSPFDCYPDLLVNNLTDPGVDTGFFAGGMAVLVNSSNRDRFPPITNAPRLDTTTIGLEFAGQRPAVLDGNGEAPAGFIFPRADNTTAQDRGTDESELARIAGSRFVAGGFEYIFQDQTPREGLFGHRFRALGDLTADGFPELIISAPRNERYFIEMQEFAFPTQWASTIFPASITILPGTNYNDTFWREQSGEDGTSTQPTLDQQRFSPFGNCTGNPPVPRHQSLPAESLAIFAEDIDDFLGDAQSAGDFNQDGLDDILAGAPRNDFNANLPDSGAVYIIYGRTTFGEIQLTQADNPTLRPPMLRVRGTSINDQIGWSQTAGLDVNGDRIDDVFISSPLADFGGVTRASCAGDFDGDGTVTQSDLTELSFTTCRNQVGREVFADDPCKAFDYDNDTDIDDDDRCIFCCLSNDCVPAASCFVGNGGNCCVNSVDNGFAGIIFGGVGINGDRQITQLATSQLPGVAFYGGQAGDRAGFDVSSAGDFNQDGFGDILISAPGRSIADGAGRTRRGLVYLVFGGTHLFNTTWSLDEVGTPDLPGIVFYSPYVEGRPNEAAPTTVAFIGDINSDGFGDIAIGNPKADFIDPSFPQGPDAPGSDPATGRRTNVGDVYVIYGNNFGTNRLNP